MSMAIGDCNANSQIYEVEVEVEVGVDSKLSTKKSICRGCEGRQLVSAHCPHGKRNSVCNHCGGGSMCKHGLQKLSCKECGGGNFCERSTAGERAPNARIASPWPSSSILGIYIHMRPYLPHSVCSRHVA